MRALTEFWDFVDNRAIVRRIAFFVTLYMSFDAFVWAKDFAATTAKSGAEVALIMAAVTAPVAALQGFVVKVYTEFRDK